jgi:hypothetical protein
VRVSPRGGRALCFFGASQAKLRERTADEYAALYRRTGFELVRIVPVHPTVSVIEGRPV